MITIHTKAPVFEPAVLDMILKGQMGETKLWTLAWRFSFKMVREL
jgi:hypothetical protein